MNSEYNPFEALHSIFIKKLADIDNTYRWVNSKAFSYFYTYHNKSTKKIFPIYCADCFIVDFVKNCFGDLPTSAQFPNNILHNTYLI